MSFDYTTKRAEEINQVPESNTARCHLICTLDKFEFR